jgi:hypothetical protein
MSLSGGFSPLEVDCSPAWGCPMIDTFEGGYRMGEPGAAEVAAFCGAVVGPVAVRAAADEAGTGLRPVQWSGRIPGLGACALNVDGWLRLGGSLAKFRQKLLDGTPDDQCSNEQILTASQCDETLQALCEHAEKTFPFLDRAVLSATRLDVVYQRPVRSSYEALTAVRGAMKSTRKGAAWFDNAQGVATGLVLRGVAVSHRIYDKGLESGNKSMVNVLRSEEQLRHKAVAFDRIFNLEQRSFNREACREVINERYLGAEFGGVLDVSSLIEEGRHSMALFVLHPELQAQYKQTVSKSGYHKMVKQVKEFRSASVPDDLRVPEGAWQ